MLGFLMRKDVRKLLKRKDSDAGEKGIFKIYFFPCGVLLKCVMEGFGCYFLQIGWSKSCHFC